MTALTAAFKAALHLAGVPRLRCRRLRPQCYFQTMAASNTNVLSSEKLLKHWQGHRRLTRRVIEAFPDDKLFSYSIGGMRPFAEIVKEFLRMAVPIARGVASGEWVSNDDFAGIKSKADLLALWDQATSELDTVWSTIPQHRFSEVDKAFGQWEGEGIDSILYAIDNEVHHRGQGYVYLRSLGIEPPHFYDRD